MPLPVIEIYLTPRETNRSQFGGSSKQSVSLLIFHLRKERKRNSRNELVRRKLIKVCTRRNALYIITNKYKEDLGRK